MDEAALQEASRRIAESPFTSLSLLHTLADLYQTTGEKPYLDVLRAGWNRANLLTGLSASPIGTIPAPSDALGEWLRLTLRLWFFTQEDALLERAERLWQNHKASLLSSSLPLQTLAQMLYTYDERGLWINFFAEGEARLTLSNDSKAMLIQRTPYPETGRVTLEWIVPPPGRLTVRVRLPEGTVPGGAYVNGEATPWRLEGRRMVITREWRPRESLSVTFALMLRTEIESAGDGPSVPLKIGSQKRNGGRVAFFWGPLMISAWQPDKGVVWESIYTDEGPDPFETSLPRDRLILGGTPFIPTGPPDAISIEPSGKLPAIFWRYLLPGGAGRLEYSIRAISGYPLTCEVQGMVIFGRDEASLDAPGWRLSGVSLKKDGRGVRVRIGNQEVTSGQVAITDTLTTYTLDIGKTQINSFFGGDIEAVEVEDRGDAVLVAFIPPHGKKRNVSIWQRRTVLPEGFRLQDLSGNAPFGVTKVVRAKLIRSKSREHFLQIKSRLMRTQPALIPKLSSLHQGTVLDCPQGAAILYPYDDNYWIAHLPGPGRYRAK